MKSIQLRTEISIKSSEWTLDTSTPILTLGSCFAEVLGNQLSSYKFPVLSNPFGTVFNPYSMAQLLTMALENIRPSEELYVRNSDGIWLHYDFHSMFWATSKRELEALLVKKLDEVRTFLSTAKVLVLTFGTAHVYRYRKNLAILSNCHKSHPNEFVKELLSHDQLINRWSHLIQTLGLSRKILLTISPVRHVRDTLPMNQVSKSVLRIFCHRLSEMYPNVSYFPSYEIMMDDLRDYRFYGPDLIHPNEVAEEYIFQLFSKTYIQKETLTLMEEWDAILKMLEHRPRHGLTPGYKSHLKTIHTRLLGVSESLNVSSEIHEIEQRISEFPDEG
ncbi:GSCFA domain-containing protein [Arundinibacter roseus]|uniref:GSCFA domain-containing protein n=1 Tax=Arundinibacter roseus TaxID=2070510 RepID=A0A4R4KB67_9BACT|nr:GSCFA domain-containing protein [Arundinibacter roseus]TDB65107.1 GSCFA domain-containing protein [Arundinibacter roseus]